MKDTHVKMNALRWAAMAAVTGGAVPVRADGPVPEAASRPIITTPPTVEGGEAVTDPDEIRRGVRMGGSVEERQRQANEAVARRAEPSLKGTAERLPAYVEFFKRDAVRDPRIFAFSARAEAQGDGTVVLSGYAEYPEHREGIARLLASLGFDRVRNEIEQLPSKDLGERRFAIVTASHALIYDKTARPRETMTEAVLGDRLWLLKATDDGYFLCHSGEGYTGYIEQAKVKVVTKEAFLAQQNGSTGVVLRDAGDGSGGHFLPAGSRLAWRGEERGRASLADVAGNVYSLPGAMVAPPGAHRAALLDAVIASAFKLEGTKYVWGGRTSEGVDCSGLVQTSYGAHGIYLPRDADQQGLVGLLVATRQCREGLRKGDALFFMSKRGTVHHTALYIGNGEYIEAAGPGVKVTSFDPKSPKYDQRRDDSFCFAKRFVE